MRTKSHQEGLYYYYVKGINSRKLKESCVNPLWSVLLFILEIAIISLLVIYGRKKQAVRYLLLEGAVTLLSVFIAGWLFCQWGIVIVTGLIGIAGIILLII